MKIPGRCETLKTATLFGTEKLTIVFFYGEGILAGKMPQENESRTWQDYLKPYSDGSASALFDPEIIARWGDQPWEPLEDDRSAASDLHIQIISRITTQRLGYLDGVEKAALASVHALFEKTRSISTQHVKATHFNAFAWHVLNEHVRPFTARWHGISEAGGLTALDSTDEFRCELDVLQSVLRRFEDLLRDIRDQAPHGSSSRPGVEETSEEKQILEEMARPLPFQISGSELDQVTIDAINAKEKSAIAARREFYEIPDKEHAVGLALSGGGIRSATFSLGVLVALARRGLLPQFDYLSTVSGGGYLGSFLTAFLNSPAAPSRSPSEKPDSASESGKGTDHTDDGPEIGLCPVQTPFPRKEGEAAALRHIRHHSRYLAMGSTWGQVEMICAQLYGLATNIASIAFLVALIVLLERLLRGMPFLTGVWKTATVSSAIALAVAALLAPGLLRARGKFQKYADSGLALLSVVLLLCLGWWALGFAHDWIHSIFTGQLKWKPWDERVLLTIAGVIPVIASTLTRLFGTKFKRTGALFVVLFAISAPVCLFAMYLLMYEWAQGNTSNAAAFGDGPLESPLSVGLLAAGAAIYLFVLNINFTSPHRHYRNKLAEAYLIQRRGMKPSGDRPPASVPEPFEEAVSLCLSEATSPRAPYHLINAALNVPASRDLKMQGRLTDFFLFSPAFCGSPLTGYRETKEWEKVDRHLDLGTAMAISGAAAAPQMGLGTLPQFRFWLALLNIRLGYWVRNPAKRAGHFGGTPGLWFLLKEMLGSMDEKSPWLNVSDGGHIENLGVYELLRRRCKFIVAVDGEQDPRMTFGALTTLQRLAAIDLGVRIDINLDDLRLSDKGYSRSHFRFCRIKYPGGAHGYLLYLKLSLTGNEGEFLRRYQLDEPAFPHHSTADQFFSEAQFEAYRSLGEHVGDKLFLRALVGKLGDSDSVKVEEWFGELGKHLLHPLPNPAR